MAFKGLFQLQQFQVNDHGLRQVRLEESDCVFVPVLLCRAMGRGEGGKIERMTSVTKIPSQS